MSGLFNREHSNRQMFKNAGCLHAPFGIQQRGFNLWASLEHPLRDPGIHQWGSQNLSVMIRCKRIIGSQPSGNYLSIHIYG